MEFKRKDKNGRDLIIEIHEYHTSEDTPNRIRCYITTLGFTINLLFYKIPMYKTIHYKDKLLSDVITWGCDEYNTWVDDVLKEFNLYLKHIEDEAKAIKFIEDGCQSK